MSIGMSAKGHTHIIMVLNMRRFVRPEDQERFETLRGAPEFVEILRSNCSQWTNQDKFLPLLQYQEQHWDGTVPPEEHMSDEEVGFATGVFRTLMLERFNSPTYVLDKNKVIFDDALRSNFQFKTLFLRAWERWEIYLRPTFSGFFVIRLTQSYQTRSRSFMLLAKDVMRLQEALDIRSAQSWLARNRQRYQEHPDTLAEKERSVKRLLDWMGADEEQCNQLLYYPVQWKLAMEVASRFVEAIGGKIDVPGKQPINLYIPEPSLSIPLHDSYIVHHFDEILADPEDVRRVKKTSTNSNARIKVSVHDIRQSPRLKRNLMNLIEGSILRDRDVEGGSEADEGFHFPEPRWSISDALDTLNQASWNDELCLLAGRTAIISPAPRWRNHEIAVSTVPSATLQARYTRYWDAIERMVEFVLEVRVLAQLVESLSYDLLGKIITPVHATRNKLFGGDIQMDQSLPGLIERAAHLRRLTALVQSLSHPMLWSRAEYAIQKADYLLDQLGVNQTIEHIQRNIEGINSVVDHVDELYLADLAEKNNEKATILSVSLAAASLTLTLLMLPSFWTEVGFNGPPGSTPSLIQTIIGCFGTLIAGILVVCAIGLLWITIFKRHKEMGSFFRRFINGKN